MMHRMLHYKLPYHFKLAVRRLVSFWSFECGTYLRASFNQWWRFFITLTGGHCAHIMKALKQGWR